MLLKEELGEQGNSLFAIPEQWNPDVYDVQTVVEIATERVLDHRSFQVMVAAITRTSHKLFRWRRTVETPDPVTGVTIPPRV